MIDMGFERDAYSKAVTGLIGCCPSDINQLQKTPRACTGPVDTIPSGCSHAEIEKSKTS